MTVKTVERLLDARIDHVVTIDFQGFTDLVDALGGIDLTVPVPFNRYGHVFKGRMHMDGDTALNFAQEHYGFKDGDYQRARDQQLLSKTIMDKTLSNSTTVSNVVGEFSPYVAVDDSLTETKLAKLAFSLRQVRGDKVHFFTLPTAGASWSRHHGQSIVLPDSKALAAIGKALRRDDLDGFTRRFRLGCKADGVAFMNTL